MRRIRDQFEKSGRLYLNMDCMEGMKAFPDNYFDLALVDPQYGRGKQPNVRRTHTARQSNGGKMPLTETKYKATTWDIAPPDPDYFEELLRVSRHQIIWGANYHPFLLTGGRIVWDKVNDGADQSNAEIASCSLNEKVTIFRYMWRGMMQGKSMKEGHIVQGDKSKNERRIHPTQKPIALYRWMLQQFAKPGDKVLDTHVGSGSSLIACEVDGFSYVGFELDLDYYRESVQRIERKRHVRKSQLNLFNECRQ